MSSATTLYAWANPVKAFPRQADHTWVTTFDAPFACSSGGPPQDYWYCWGDCHPAGPKTTARQLGRAAGDLGLARCLCEPNHKVRHPFDPAAGGINFYGIEGVCHQVANRILYTTKTGGRPPLTVDGAHGYEYSVLVYGVYGKNEEEWVTRRQRCGAPADSAENRESGFMLLARNRLGPEFSAGKLGALRNLEESLQREKANLDVAVQQGAFSGRDFGQRVNDLVDTYRMQIAALLGPGAFQTMFRAFSEERVDVVDVMTAAGIDYTMSVTEMAGKDMAPPVRGKTMAHRTRKAKKKRVPAKKAALVVRQKAAAHRMGQAMKKGPPAKKARPMVFKRVRPAKRAAAKGAAKKR